MKLMVINGPNLSRLDIRDSSIYGDLNYAELKSMIDIAATKHGFEADVRQSDDEATIIVTYPDAQVVIQASWNWPIGRKDMELYGLTGVLYSDNRTTLRVREAKGYDDYTEEVLAVPNMKTPYHDPFAFFAAVIQAKITPPLYDLSSLENNMLVMEILEAARKSANTKRTVQL